MNPQTVSLLFIYLFN